MTLRTYVAAVIGHGPVATAIAGTLGHSGATVVRPLPEETAEAVVARAASVGPLGVLVNCPGIGSSGRAEELTDADWADALTAVVTSTGLACRAALPAMRQQRFGRIVNLSDRQYLAAPGNVAFGAAAGGVVSLTRALALDAIKDGITVNCVVAGTVDVGQIAALTEEERERLRKLHPVGRLGSPEDVANAAMFFLSDESAYITGQTLFVCGGVSIYSSLSV